MGCRWKRQQAMKNKTDNKNIAAKLKIRRYFLNRYHTDEPPRVLDCCAGGEILWTLLRGEFTVKSYWPLDIKRKSGRLNLDSVLVLSRSGWSQNVIDIDTYGGPWKHYAAMLPNVTQDTTVFLTIGNRNITSGADPPKNITQLELDAIGIGELLSEVSPGHRAMLLLRQHDFILRTMLKAAESFCEIKECAEVRCLQATRYVGLRLKSKNKKA